MPMRSLVRAEDEALHDVFGDLEPVLRLEILREHRARKVDGEHDVDAFARHVFRMRAGARPRERDDRRREQEIAQTNSDECRRATGARPCREHGHAREDDGRRSPLTTHEPPDRQQ